MDCKIAYNAFLNYLEKQLLLQDDIEALNNKGTDTAGLALNGKNVL
ncbi:MAG: hypothetical protein ABJC98_05130 [Bacteroidota bacterium]